MVRTRRRTTTRREHNFFCWGTLAQPKKHHYCPLYTMVTWPGHVITSLFYVNSYANMLAFQKRRLGPLGGLFGLWSWISNLLSPKSWSHWH